MKNWHVANNETTSPGVRLHEISDFTRFLISTFQEIYAPGEMISVNESIIFKKVGFRFDSITQKNFTSLALKCQNCVRSVDAFESFHYTVAEENLT